MSQFETPPELNNLLIDFTVSVLVNQPSDVLEYAASYFDRLLEERRLALLGNNHHDGSGGDDDEESGDEAERARTSGGTNHCNNDDDNDSTSSDISMSRPGNYLQIFTFCPAAEPPARLSFTRRKSGKCW